MTSRFAGLKAMREHRNLEETAVTPSEQPTASEPVTTEAGLKETAKRRVGRPAGKRSDPNYQQVTVLLHQETYREVRKRLLDEKKEVSTLLNELLDVWLKS
ncbi:hypothetical protein [Deinococcus altitudinis]|uniref:hypothetical protein n=1 Tax=Deinococcus altitudinis TaxID=468914 RepID=UPI003891BF12